MTTIEEIVAKYPGDAAEYAKVTGERRTKFEAWMIELETEHRRLGQPYGEKPIAEITGPMCWLSFFDDDFTPAEALAEDLSNADSDDEENPDAVIGEKRGEP